MFSLIRRFRETDFSALPIISTRFDAIFLCLLRKVASSLLERYDLLAWNAPLNSI